MKRENTQNARLVPMLPKIEYGQILIFSLCNVFLVAIFYGITAFTVGQFPVDFMLWEPVVRFVWVCTAVLCWLSGICLWAFSLDGGSAAARTPIGRELLHERLLDLREQAAKIADEERFGADAVLGLEGLTYLAEREAKSWRSGAFFIAKKIRAIEIEAS